MADDLVARYIRTLGELVGRAPTPSNPEGRRAVSERLVRWAKDLGFTVTAWGDEPASRVFLAHRPGQGMSLGLCGHYDVEEAGDGWHSAPWSLTTLSGRIFGRGVADNLGPLALRLLALEDVRSPTASLSLILQGEEEIGSPFAHELFPRIPMPPIDLWVEETGYFEQDGSQRLLAKDLDARTDRVVSELEACLHAAGREGRRHPRYLNKAFGTAHCPFLMHLVRGAPYVAIGPNDSESRIHQPNESLALDNVAVAVSQFQRLVTFCAGGA
jgi:acetylornithine deacetylase/succinyl-diaminopimelate desuccinylase-like protein